MSFVLAEPGDPAVGDRDVRIEPLAREHGEDPAAADDHVGGLVASGDGKPSKEVVVGHGEAILP